MVEAKDGGLVNATRGRSGVANGRFLNITLALVALAASLAPIVREALESRSGSISPGGATPLNLASAELTIKLGIGVTSFAALLFSLLWRGRGDVVRRFAAMPLIRTTLVGAASVAAGLGGFDVCTSYHAAGPDSSGACHCWVTGVVTGLAALITLLLTLTGRALASLAHDLIRTIIEGFTRLAPAKTGSRGYLGIGDLPQFFGGEQLAWRLAGRAPPLTA